MHYVQSSAAWLGAPQTLTTNSSTRSGPARGIATQAAVQASSTVRNDKPPWLESTPRYAPCGARHAPPALRLDTRSAQSGISTTVALCFYLVPPELAKGLPPAAHPQQSPHTDGPAISAVIVDTTSTEQSAAKLANLRKRIDEWTHLSEEQRDAFYWLLAGFNDELSSATRRTTASV